MAVNENDVLSIGVVRYNLETVLKLAKIGPNVIIGGSQLNNTEIDEFKIKLETAEPFPDTGSIIFFKQNGGYTIILGSETAYKTMNNQKFDGSYPGYLISTVALKKARLE